MALSARECQPRSTIARRPGNLPQNTHSVHRLVRPAVDTSVHLFMTAEVDAPNRHPSVDRMLPDCGQDGVTVDRTTRDAPTYERLQQLETARGFTTCSASV